MKIRVEEEYEGQVARVFLAAPKANIVDRAMMTELESAFEQLATRRDLKAIVLAGEGSHFSFGASVQEHLPEQIDHADPASSAAAAHCGRASAYHCRGPGAVFGRRS